jgi:hypothetical protein
MGSSFARLRKALPERKAARENASGILAICETLESMHRSINLSSLLENL